MKTIDLISLLAADAGPAPRVNPALRLVPAMAGGVFMAGLLSIALLGLVPAQMLAEPALWLKLAYAGAIAAGACWLAARLARPLSHTRGPVTALVAVTAAMVLLGLAAVYAAAPGARVDALLGTTWYRCPLIIPTVALPALAALLWTLRGLAPTRLREAGLAAGLLAGALGAMGYALHCTEVSPAFVALWYSLGIFATGALGALLGPYVLRW